MTIRKQTAEKLEQKAEDTESLRLIDTAKSFLSRDMNDVKLPKGTQFFAITKIDPVRRGGVYYFEFYRGHTQDYQNYGNGTKIERGILYRVPESTENLNLNV